MKRREFLAALGAQAAALALVRERAQADAKDPRRDVFGHNHSME